MVRSNLKAWLTLALAAGLAIGSMAAWPGLAGAAVTFVVNRTNDPGDININNGVCDTSAASGLQCLNRTVVPGP
jgi:hypothetical protein